MIIWRDFFARGKKKLIFWDVRVERQQCAAALTVKIILMV